MACHRVPLPDIGSSRAASLPIRPWVWEVFLFFLYHLFLLFFHFSLFDGVRFQYSPIFVIFFYAKCLVAFLTCEFYSFCYSSSAGYIFQCQILFLYPGCKFLSFVSGFLFFFNFCQIFLYISLWHYELNICTYMYTHVCVCTHTCARVCVYIYTHACSTIWVARQSRRFLCLFWRETRQRILGPEISPYPEVVRGREWELAGQRSWQAVDGRPGREQLALDCREASRRELAWNHGQGQSTPDSGDSSRQDRVQRRRLSQKMSAFQCL